MDAEDIAKNFFTMNRNEAIEIVKKNWPNNGFTQLKDALETLIPELRVSEDERIRRKMLEHFRNKTKETWCNIPVKDIITYLEKQKEQKPEIKYVYPIFKVGDTIKPKAYNESHRIDKIKDDNYVLDNGFKFPIVGQDVWEIVQQKPAELPKSEDYGIDGLYAALDILQKTLGKVEGYQTDDGIIEHKCAISAVKELYEQKPMYNLEIPAGDVASAEEDGPFDEDEFLDDELSAFLQNYDKEYDDDAAVSDVAKHFYELGKKVKQQPAQWSEEDEKMLLGIIERGSSQIPSHEPALRGEQMEWLMNRLKFLRPQPHTIPKEIKNLD